MKKPSFIIAMFLLISSAMFAQVGINADISAPDASAGLDVNFNNKGFLPPRMTFAQRNAIANPAQGLSVICTNCNSDGTSCFSIYLGSQWLNMSVNCALPVSPIEGTHGQSSTQIIWNWIAVPIATGYMWNTTNSYATATDMATATSKTETGLTSGNFYTRYVWAYNACGNSTPTILHAQALTCGSSFTVLHLSGSVAPVSKSVTYGTITNIPGETSKCWITRNLGASQQATTVSDGSEASDGWYWQFNRKQGYKLADDGETRTPASTWLDPINENSDWQSTNDPCSLLLGSVWRIPTNTEWTNVDATGNWINWNGQWDAGLKMNGAGMLLFTDGTLWYRNESGSVWTSMQNSDNSKGYYLEFTSVHSLIVSSPKSTAFSIRCIRN